MKPEHLEIISRGVEAWNEWRRKNPTIWPDLTRAYLPRYNLDSINFQNAHLLGAVLESASLERANLRNSNLKDTKVAQANLRNANLIEANLYNSDLRETDLRYSNLRYANLTKANLDGAQLDFTTFGHTSIGQTTLAGVLGLERATHSGLTSIDVVTLERSADDLRQHPSKYTKVMEFFRRSGVPRHLIDHYKGRLDSYRKWYTCFISYSHEDEKFVSYLWDYLQGRGVSCAYDEKDLSVGEDILDKVGEEIIGHDRMLLVCSASSLKSQWVQKEVHIALQKEGRTHESVLIPIDLDGYALSTKLADDLASVLKSRVVASFVGWEANPSAFKNEFKKILASLRVER